MEVGKEDLRARGEVVPSDEVVAVPRGEVVDHHGPASCNREVDRDVRETRGCRHWRKGGWRWNRRG